MLTSANQLTTEIPQEVKEQHYNFSHGDDRHADPEPQLAADVGEQLENLIIRHFFHLHQVVIGEVDGDTDKVLLGVGPVGMSEVVLIEFEFFLCLRCNSTHQLLILRHTITSARACCLTQPPASCPAPVTRPIL